MDHRYNISRPKIIALYGGLCLFFALLEKLLPQVGFFKYGLANLPVLLALPFFRPKDLFLVVIIKVIGLGLLHGTVTAHIFILSLSGSLLSALTMLLSYRLFSPRLSLVGVSVLGALASNGIQIALAIGFIFGPGYLALSPVLLLLGTITALILGLIAQHMSQSSRWVPLTKRAYLWGRLPRGPEQIKKLPLPKPWKGSSPSWLLAHRNPKAAKDKIHPLIPPKIRALWGLVVMILFLLIQCWVTKLFFVLLFALLSRLGGKKIWVIYFILSTLSIVFFNLLVPGGPILWEWGPFSLTRDALFLEALPKALTFTGLIFISLFSIHKELKIPGKIGGYLSKAFEIYANLMDLRGQIKKQNLMLTIDRALCRFLQSPSTEKKSKDASNKTKSLGWFLIASLSFLLLTFLLAENNLLAFPPLPFFSGFCP